MGRRAGALVLALVGAAWFGAPVHGQQPAGVPANQVETDPIKCWWKTDKNAVRVGEPFTLALTCGVIETDAVRVVVDPARLDPAAVQMTPFEVLGGIRHNDIAAPPWRYFQYSYTLRLLADEFFGRDVDIPGLPMTYRVQAASGDAGQGRDELYLLPALPVRVLSLVPVTATDIRDAPPETFADIDSRRTRATVQFAAAGLLFVLAAVIAGVAVARAVRSREPQPVAGMPLPVPAVFRACERDAQRVKAETVGGWTPELIERALTAFRIASAVALGRTVAQTLVDRRERPSEGQLVLEKGLRRKQRVLISASTTASVIAERLASDRYDIEPTVREALEDMAAPLHVLGTAHYSRSGQLDTDALDHALERGLRGLQRLRSAKPWPARAAEALARRAEALREATWAR